MVAGGFSSLLEPADFPLLRVEEIAKEAPAILDSLHDVVNGKVEMENLVVALEYDADPFLFELKLRRSADTHKLGHGFPSPLFPHVLNAFPDSQILTQIKFTEHCIIVTNDGGSAFVDRSVRPTPTASDAKARVA